MQADSSAQDMATNTVSYLDRIGSLASPRARPRPRLTVEVPPLSPRVPPAVKEEEEEEVVPETPPHLRPRRSPVSVWFQSLSRIKSELDHIEASVNDWSHRDDSQPEEKVQVPPTPEPREEEEKIPELEHPVVLPPPPQAAQRSPAYRASLMRRWIQQKQQRLDVDPIKYPPKKKRHTADYDIVTQPRRSLRVRPQ